MTRSLIAPVVSYEPPRSPTQRLATVIRTVSTRVLFQIDSKMELARRGTGRSCSVSLAG